LEFETFVEGNTAYTVFWSREDKNHQRRLDCSFAIMKAKVDLPQIKKNTDKSDMYGDHYYMLNLRVDNMETILEHLKQKKIEVLGTQDEDYGLFSWIYDPDGNRIELYQPVRDDY